MDGNKASCSRDKDNLETAEEAESIEPAKKRRKGVRNDINYQRNFIKNARVCGVEYINYKNKTVNSKCIGPRCSCPMKCFDVINEEQRNLIFTKFYGMKTKNEQDIYLQGQLQATTVSQKRKRKENGKDRNRSFLHFVNIGEKRLKVCQGAFASIHAIGLERIKRLKRLLINNESPCDKRGTNIKGNAMEESDRELVRTHIMSFPVKESHYSGKEYKYLDARLNVKIMYEMFVKKFPETKIKYSYYIKFFHENFNLHFGRPQVDTCNMCEELTLKIKSPSLGDNAKRVAVCEKIVHERRAKKFYNALRTTAAECKERQDLAAIAFDYMQNLQLPNTPVQDLFYLSQLSVSVFCIHDLKTNKSFFYIYHEMVAAKSPNEVCTFIMEYIEKYVSPDAKELRLFSDNCAGQNKNHCVINACMALAESGRFQKVQQYYPIRGHSFLPCDRDFGVIKRTLRKADRVYDVHTYTELIITSSAKNAFTLKEVATEDIIDYKNWWPKYYKASCASEETEKRPRNERLQFSVSKFHHFVHEAAKPGIVEASENINGFMWHTFKLDHPRRSKNIQIQFPQQKAYKEKLPILETKLDNLKTLVRWVEDEHKQYYAEIIENATVKKPKKKKTTKNQ